MFPEEGNQPLKKLKIILLYSFILISIIYIIIINIKKINFSIYEKDTSAIQGRILDYKINGNQLQIKIKARFILSVLL